MDAVRSLRPSRNSANWAGCLGCAAPQLWQKDAYGSTRVPQLVQNGNAPVLPSSISMYVHERDLVPYLLASYCLPSRRSIASITRETDSERLSRSVRHS